VVDLRSELGFDEIKRPIGLAPDLEASRFGHWEPETPQPHSSATCQNGVVTAIQRCTLRTLSALKPLRVNSLRDTKDTVPQAPDAESPSELPALAMGLVAMFVLWGLLAELLLWAP